MGFDQYHEPPDELPDETRTFARLCASLTEEAEAIGWYEQRMAVEPDREARAIMRNAQGEEFKHFGMDLEFLLRRTPLWREIAEGILFQEGDIVEHGEEAEEEASRARRRGARPRPAHVARHRQPERSRVMSHLLREHAPITEASWSLIDDEARERLTPALAARKLVDFAGPHGWEHSATNLGRTHRARRRAGDGVKPRSAACWRSSSCGRRSRSRAPSCATPTGAREDVDLAALDDGRPSHRDGGEPRRLPRLAGRGHHGHRARPRRTTRSRSARTASCTRATSPRAVEALLRAGIDGPYGLALGPDAYTRVLETTEHGGYPLLDHLRKIIGGPLVWAPGVDGAVVVSQRGGDFLLRRRRGPLGRLRPPRRRHRRPLPRGELHLPRRHAGGGGGADALTRRRTAQLPEPPGTGVYPRRVQAEQILAFRLARSGLAARDARRPRRGGGLPRLGLLPRRRAARARGAMEGLTREHYDAAVDSGELVVAHVVRGAIHALAPDDHALYGRALISRDDDELAAQLGEQVRRMAAEKGFAPDRRARGGRRGDEGRAAAAGARWARTSCTTRCASGSAPTSCRGARAARATTSRRCCGATRA